MLKATGIEVPFLPGAFDLHLAPGEFVRLGGPSGSGKTTTLRAVAGLEARAKGTLALEGRPVEASALPAYRRQVVYLPQLPPAFACSGREVLTRIAGFQSGGGVALDEARLDALLGSLELPPGALDRPLGELSVGEQQRMSLIRALYLEPRVLLLDEPTSALDPEAKEAAAAALQRWHAGGERAAVLVTHDPELAERLCTRTLPVGTP
ncbi:MAG: ATP-binding cassette domain-containing protein [Deltaproteobacteria bacterium]|nr:ATP-binding cassette domain-containing protein [Deltaproteobacteria bacterium]